MFTQASAIGGRNQRDGGEMAEREREKGKRRIKMDRANWRRNVRGNEENRMRVSKNLRTEGVREN